MLQISSLLSHLELAAMTEKTECHLRENLVKTGWASWENKWREEIFKEH
jgi:hypothetical protein